MLEKSCDAKCEIFVAFKHMILAKPIPLIRVIKPLTSNGLIIF